MSDKISQKYESDSCCCFMSTHHCSHVGIVLKQANICIWQFVCFWTCKSKKAAETSCALFDCGLTLDYVIWQEESMQCSNMCVVLWSQQKARRCAADVSPLRKCSCYWLYAAQATLVLQAVHCVSLSVLCCCVAAHHSGVVQTCSCCFLWSCVGSSTPTKWRAGELVSSGFTQKC